MSDNKLQDISLRDYIDIRIKSVEDKLDAQSRFSAQYFALNEVALKKAEEAMLVRLEGLNYVTREQLSKIDKCFEDRIRRIEMSGSFSSGKLWMVMAAFAAIPTIIALLAFVRSL